jgi:hypothetical protein
MGVDIVDRIQKLLAKANSTTSLAETESIMVMVQGLLTKHGISLLQVAQKADEYDPVGTDYEAFHFWAADNWSRRLAVAAGEYYGVRVFWRQAGNKTHVITVGRESCRAAFSMMTPYLCRQVRRLAERGVRSGHYLSQTRGCTQVSIALGNRLLALAAVDDRSERGRKEQAGRNMLIPVDLIEEEIKANLGVIREKTLRTKTFVTLQALRDAESINLADQLRRDGVAEQLLDMRGRRME